MPSQWANETFGGARAYWHLRIAPQPILALSLSLAFLLVLAILSLAARREFALGWFAIGLGALVGDVSILIKALRCVHCGFVVAPAPAFHKQCPGCGRIMQI